MTNLLHPFIYQLILILVKIICLLVAIAYYTLAERKIMASIQRRRGPNVVGVWGLLQPLADGLKLIAKEIIIPSHSNSRIFVIAPLVILTLGLLTWSIIPFGCYDLLEQTPKVVKDPRDLWFFQRTWETYHMLRICEGTDSILHFLCLSISFELMRSIYFNLVPKTKPVETVDSLDVKTPATNSPQDGKNSLDVISEVNDISDIHYSLLLVLALSSLTVYGLIIAGWASNSKYAFLGALRSAAQMISYEVAINLVILPVITISGSLNFVEIVNLQQNTGWFMIPLSPISLIFFISMIAETNRTPFDLPEAEAELVAGYNVEYSSIIFAIFFLAEYSNMIIISLLKSLLFLAGWDGAIGPLLPATAFSLKGLVFCFLFVLVRATFPRYRYDQLINIGWKIFLPVATGFLILVVGNLFAFDGLPVLQELNLANYSE